MKKQLSQSGSQVGEHAIVIGASISGLYWLLRISVLKQSSKQQREQWYRHLHDGETEWEMI
jgi:hypothetical protein